MDHLTLILYIYFCCCDQCGQWRLFQQCMRTMSYDCLHVWQIMCYALTFLLWSVSSDLHLKGEPFVFYLHSWRCLRMVDFDNNKPSSFSVLDLARCCKGGFLQQQKHSIILFCSSRPLYVAELASAFFLTKKFTNLSIWPPQRFLPSFRKVSFGF